MDSSIKETWPAWRLIIEQVAQLNELDGNRATYSLADVLKANAVLDMRQDLEIMERNKKD